MRKNTSHLRTYRASFAKLLIQAANWLAPEQAKNLTSPIKHPSAINAPAAKVAQNTIDTSLPQQSVMTHPRQSLVEAHVTLSELKKVFEGHEWAKLMRNARDGGASSIMACQVLAKTAKLLEFGFKHVVDMMNASDEVRDASRRLATISEDIKQISNHSRIVSINASIEANRAGEHGRTFQIVSQQMTDLAEDVRQLTVSMDSSLMGVNDKIEINRSLCGKVGKLFTNMNSELEEFRKLMMRVEELSIIQIEQLKKLEIDLVQEREAFKVTSYQRDISIAEN